MAHPKAARETLRKAYVYGQLTLEISAMQARVSVGTARRWKADAKAEGDDWDKVKAAHVMAGGSLDEIGREILTGFLLQYRTTMEQLNNAELPAETKVSLLASLSDAFNKTIAANKRILPETTPLATALEVLKLQADYIQANHPEALESFIKILDGFGMELERRYG